MHYFNICGEKVLSNRIYLIILDIFIFFYFFWKDFQPLKRDVCYKPNSGCRALYFLELGA